MKTSKPFSTISYNSKDFLISKLDELVQKRHISFYAFVEHYPEDDEKKKHKHLIIIPNGQVQTDQITDLLQEMDITNPLKPLGVMPWRSSKWGDWYLYTCHDSAYLMSKGQTRKHHYQEQDFTSSNYDYMHELITTIDRTKYVKSQEFYQKAVQGIPFIHLVGQGQVPMPQFNQYKAMYDYIQDITFRNGRQTHSPKDSITVYESTGEVL